MKSAQQAFKGLQADTSSDEEFISPIIAGTCGPISQDLADLQINPWVNELAASSSTETAICIYDSAADTWRFDNAYGAAEATLEEKKRGIENQTSDKRRFSSSTHCRKRCNCCKARPCALMKEHDVHMVCACKLAIANVPCNLPHHKPAHERFSGDRFIGPEEDLINSLVGTVGELVTADDSHFDNVTMRLEPSMPTFPKGVETWPEGTPSYIKEMFEKHQKICSRSDSTTDGIDTWYFKRGGIKGKSCSAAENKSKNRGGYSVTLLQQGLKTRQT